MIEEARLRIHVNGRPRILLSCSPHEPLVLATGHLLAEGWIRDVGDLVESVVHNGDVHLTLPGARVEAWDSAQDAALHAATVMLPSPPPHPGAEAALPQDPALLLRALFAAVDDAAPDGGVHGAAASDGAALLHVSHDIARHCCVDRVIGARALHADAAVSSGLVTTARVSGAMAMKAARARFAWIVTRGLATSLAHEIAQQHGIVILERAGRRGAG